MDLDKESAPTSRILNGHTVIGTTPVKITLDFPPLLKGALLRAPGPRDPGGGNTAVIYIGRIHVSPATGMPLPPGASLTIPCDSNGLYAVADADAQDLAWLLI
jgi:hypothetical protein